MVGREARFRHAETRSLSTGYSPDGVKLLSAAGHGIFRCIFGVPKENPSPRRKQRPDIVRTGQIIPFGGKEEVIGWQGNKPDVRPGPGGRPGSV
jgi:hypothetical protein